MVESLERMHLPPPALCADKNSRDVKLITPMSADVQLSESTAPSPASETNRGGLTAYSGHGDYSIRRSWMRCHVKHGACWGGEAQEEPRGPVVRGGPCSHAQTEIYRLNSEPTSHAAPLTTWPDATRSLALTSSSQSAGKCQEFSSSA